MAQGKAPWCGMASWLGIAVGWGPAHWRRRRRQPQAAMAWLRDWAWACWARRWWVALAVASRVRGERWPWIGIGGAVLSAPPLLMYLLRMMLKL